MLGAGSTGGKEVGGSRGGPRSGRKNAGRLDGYATVMIGFSS